MENSLFKALVVAEKSDGSFSKTITTRDISDLPPGELLIRVHWSTLNFKDALSASGHKGISRNYPHIPGVDAAGEIVTSESPEFVPGDKVIVTGYDLGMNTSGGFAEYIRVPAGWAVKLPETLTLRESMIFGTAGFTVSLAMSAMQKNDIYPESGKILVTGATGAVGSMAIAMLSRAGYSVTAATGKADKFDFLKALGASQVIGREEVNDTSGKPLLPKRWAGVIENVGGNTLSTAIRQTYPHGVIASIGLVGSNELNITVYPFILRGVIIAGIDSADTEMGKRLSLWKKMETEWRINFSSFPVKEILPEQLPEEIDLMLKGGQTGKVLVKFI